MSDTTEDNVIDFSKARGKLIPVTPVKVEDINYCAVSTGDSEARWYEHLESFGYTEEMAKFFGSTYGTEA